MLAAQWAGCYHNTWFSVLVSLPPSPHAGCPPAWKTSGYMISVAMAFLSNPVPWAYGRALWGFQVFKSTPGVLNVVVITDSGGIRSPKSKLPCPAIPHMLFAGVWFGFSPTLTPLCLGTWPYKAWGVWLWSIPWAILIFCEIHFYFPLHWPAGNFYL